MPCLVSNWVTYISNIQISFIVFFSYALIPTNNRSSSQMNSHQNSSHGNETSVIERRISIMYVRWIPQASIYSSNRIELILRSFWVKTTFSVQWLNQDQNQVISVICFDVAIFESNKWLIMSRLISSTARLSLHELRSNK